MKKGHKPHLLECFPKYFPSRNSVIHYTCNAPKQNILDKNGIISKGKDFGCYDSREVLEIPVEVYLKAGYSKDSFNNKNVLQMNSEYIIKKLGKTDLTSKF